MSTRWITDDEAFALLSGAEWNALVEALPRPTPFLLHEWLTTWRRHYGGDARLAVGVTRDDRRIVGALPLQVRRLGPVRVAEWVGGAHAQLGAPLGAPAPVEDVPGADVIRLTGLDARSPLATIARVDAPVVDLCGGWEELYRDRLSSKRRSQHRKRLRDLESAGRLRIHVARDERALSHALRLHSLRWRGRRDGSTYGLPGGDAFHRDLHRALGDRVRIALLELDDVPVAFRYGVRVGDTLVGNGIGFDPAYARFSPGWVLMLAALEDAAAEGIERVEMLGGDEQYKLQLADPAPLAEGIVPLTALGRVAAAAMTSVVHARRRARRSETLLRLYNVRPRRPAAADS